MAYIGNPIVTQAFVTDQFNGNGSTTAFTMSVAPANTASILVAVSGVMQAPDTYSVNGLTLTFSAAPPSGTGNISVRYLGIPASGVTTTAYRTITEFTATAGQTTFTPSSYTVGFINVYRNGVMLGSADFTASNGTTVVLAVGANVGDLITCENFYVSSVLNAIPNTVGSVNSSNLATGLTASVNTLNSTTGVLATQNGMTGICKAWVIFNATNGAIRGTSFNISSVTRSATAQYDLVFSTAMASANYVVTVSTSTAIGVAVAGATNLFYNKASNIEVAPTSSGFTMNTQSSGGTSIEPQYVCVAVFSS